MKTGFRDKGLTVACEMVGAVEVPGGCGHFLRICPCRQPADSSLLGAAEKMKAPPVACDELPVAPGRGGFALWGGMCSQPVGSEGSILKAPAWGLALG